MSQLHTWLRLAMLEGHGPAAPDAAVPERCSVGAAASKRLLPSSLTADLFQQGLQGPCQLSTLQLAGQVQGQLLAHHAPGLGSAALPAAAAAPLPAARPVPGRAAAAAAAGSRAPRAASRRHVPVSPGSNQVVGACGGLLPAVEAQPGRRGGKRGGEAWLGGWVSSQAAVRVCRWIE